MTEVASNMYHKSTKKNVDMDKEVWMIPEKKSVVHYELAVNIKTAAEAGFKKYNYTKKVQKSNFIYGMALHTVADIFAHSAYGISLNKKNRAKLQESDSTVEDLVNQWDRLKHGPKDENGHFYKDKNFADMKDCIEMRYKQSAQNVCSAIINEHIVEKQKKTKNKKGKVITTTDYQHTKGSLNVFLKVSYYSNKKYKDAWKYDELKKEKGETEEKYEKRILSLKRNYIINSYGIKFFADFCEDCGADEKLTELALYVDNDHMKELMDVWVKKEQEKAKEQEKVKN